jgi:hypothetical protein
VLSNHAIIKNKRKGAAEMATSSIAKTFVLKDKAALERFKNEMQKTSSPPAVTNNKLEEGKSLLKQYFSH